MLKSKFRTGLLAIFMLTGLGLTIWAMCINPPVNLDHVVMGNIDDALVEKAIDTGNESLIESYSAETPDDFFAVIQENGDDMPD